MPRNLSQRVIAKFAFVECSLIHPALRSLLFALFLLLPLAAQASNALHFASTGADGVTGNYIQTELTPSGLGYTFTLEAWVKPSEFLDNAIISNLASDAGMELHLKTGGKLVFTVRYQKPDQTYAWLDFESPYEAVILNRWSHIAVAFSNWTSVAMYVNGEEVKYTGALVGTFTGGDSKLRLGQRANGDMQFKGSLAEVQVWNTLRGKSEIQTDMGGYTAAQTGHLAYYRLNQGTAGGSNSSVTTATDLVGKYTGTLTNFVLSGASSNWVAGYDVAVAPSGAGTNDSPYLIDSLPNLQWISQNSDTWEEGVFQQTKDIDAIATVAFNDSKGFTPIGNSSDWFNGRYDGRGYKIKKLAIKNAESTHLGLFCGLSWDAVVANLRLVDASIRGTMSSQQYVGGVAGKNSGIVRASSVSGAVAASGTNSFVGGLVGYNSGMIDESFSTAAVSGGISAKAGGFAGANDDRILNSYATGAVQAGNDATAGGFIGSNEGTVKSSYAAGLVNAGTSAQVDGFIGDRSSDGSVGKDCFWNAASDAAGSSYKGQTVAELQTGSTYTGWAIAGLAGQTGYALWDMSSSRNNGYPTLYWEYRTRLTVGANPTVKTSKYTGLYTVDESLLTYGPLIGADGKLIALGARAIYGSRNVGDNIPVTVDYSLTGADANLYVPPYSFIGNIAQIVKAPLTIQANDDTIPLGSVNSTFTATYTGLVGGDSKDAVSGLQFRYPTVTTVGEYPLEPYGATSENYEISYVNGKLTVEPVVTVDAVPPSGEGTEVNPYTIDSLANLFWLSQTSSAWGSVFVQTKDIDATISRTWDGGQGFSPIGSVAPYFTGKYHGAGHQITGLTMERENESNVALFGILENGLIDSLTIEINLIGASGLVAENNGVIRNCHAKVNIKSGLAGLVAKNSEAGLIENSSVTGTVLSTSDAGGFVRYNNGIIRRCYFQGTMIGSGSGSEVGGLVGSNGHRCTYNDETKKDDCIYGRIEESFATGTVQGLGNVRYLGGLISSNSGIVSDSYFEGSVSGSQYMYVGGFVGRASSDSDAPISRCYAKTSNEGVSNVTSTSGFAGRFDADNALIDTYWDSTDVAQFGCESSSCRAKGLVTSDLMKKTSYADSWDFDSTWILYEGKTAPMLRAFMVPLEISTAPIQKVYDGNTMSAKLRYSYSVDPVDRTLLLGTCQLDGDYENAVKAGTYAVDLLCDMSSTQFGYAIRTKSGSLTITPAPLTITAPSLTYTLGAVLPTTFDFTYSGFVDGEDASALEGLTASYSCGQCKTAGKFSIVPYAKAANYTLAFVNGVLTLNAPVSVMMRNLPVVNLGNVRSFDLLGRRLVE